MGMPTPISQVCTLERPNRDAIAMPKLHPGWKPVDGYTIAPGFHTGRWRLYLCVACGAELREEDVV